MKPSKINNQYVDLIPNKYRQSYDLWMLGKQTISFSSHQPLLIHTLNTIDQGNVLEFGIGYNSSRIIHTICGIQERKVTSIETNKEWYEKFKKYNKSSWHEIKHINWWDLINWDDDLFKEHYTVAFIDGAPCEIRMPFMKKIMADYFIVHDTECVVQKKENCYHYDFSSFKYEFHFKTIPPMTSLVTNLEDYNKKLLDIF